LSIISKKEVEHVAKLAELQFSDTELAKITSELDKILGHIAKISEVDTSDIQPTSHTLKINNVFRKDKIKESLSKEQSLSNAPEEQDGGFRVPRID
jgi:aspartyl-tRNA(Asn)/glutamyl-tRNA(Gln) amidotransferase subunit C